MEDVENGFKISAWQRDPSARHAQEGEQEEKGEEENVAMHLSTTEQPSNEHRHSKIGSNTPQDATDHFGDRIEMDEAPTRQHNATTNGAVQRSSAPRQQIEQVSQRAGLNVYFLSSTATTYQFGPIEGVPVGTIYDSREAARHANVHRAPVKGIVGSKDIGCPSICVNGGYEDNIDTGYTILYSGDGGKALNQAQLAAGEQGEDQTWSPMNQALYTSYKNNRAIRVLRGNKSKGACAPFDGYRYDGLYQIIRCYIARSISFGHHKVITFALQRLPKQAPITREGKVFPEPEFITHSMNGDWIDMPKHYYLIRQTRGLVEPASIHFDDEFGDANPAEMARHRARNHSKSQHGSSKNGHGEAGGPDRRPQNRPRMAEPYTIDAPKVIIRDQFGNELAPATIQKSMAPKPVIANFEFHKQVNHQVFKELFPDAQVKHPKRGYMRWRQRCFVDNCVHQDLAEVERLDELEKQSKRA